MKREKVRCGWTGQDPDLIRYHDEEWGVPVHEDRKLYEFLLLDAAQAGLSWATVLRKRENYRLAFDGFDPAKVAFYGEEKRAELMENAGIIRNRLKIKAAISNARAFLEVVEGYGSFDRYIWRFVGGRPIKNKWETLEELPARTPESEAMSKDLKKRGFVFVGPTISYAFMQAAGMVNDHTTDCFRHGEV